MSMTTDQKLNIAIKALKYYAESSWDSGCGCCQTDFDATTNPVEDMGQKAKDALKEILE